MKFANLPHGNSALAIFPSVVGFGWAVFDGPLSPVDWGVSTVARKVKGSGKKNARSVTKIEALLAKYRPNVIVLEEFENGHTRRAERVRGLCRSIVAVASVGGIRTRIISRTAIRSCFTSTNAHNRYDIAKAVASYLPEIRHALPRKRKLWESEFPVMALFNAAALLVVHYSNPRESL